MEKVTTLFACLAALALLLSIVQTSRLTVLAVGQPGIGRILFLSIASLKLWAMLVLLYFLVNTLVPDKFGLLTDSIRLKIRTFLALYLLVQPLIVNVALWRWRRKE